MSTFLSRLLCLAVLAGLSCGAILGAQSIRNTRVPVVMQASLVMTRAENVEGLVIPGITGVWKAAHATYGFPQDGTCMEVWTVLSSGLPLADNSWSWVLSVPDPRKAGGGPMVKMAMRDDRGDTLVLLPLLFGPDSRTSSTWWYAFRFTVFDQAALGMLQGFVREHSGLLARDSRRADMVLHAEARDRVWPRIQGFFPPFLGTWLPD